MVFITISQSPKWKNALFVHPTAQRLINDKNELQIVTFKKMEPHVNYSIMSTRLILCGHLRPLFFNRSPSHFSKTFCHN